MDDSTLAKILSDGISLIHKYLDNELWKYGRTVLRILKHKEIHLALSANSLKLHINRTMRTTHIIDNTLQ